MPRAYNALTGAELKQVIMSEVERSLDNAGINSVAVTYPLASWSWSLTILQQDGQGVMKGDTPERTLTAGEPQQVEEDLADDSSANKILAALSSGSKRFRHQPPSPSEVRDAEKLPQPEA